MFETWPLRPTAFMEEMLAVESEYSIASLKIGTAESAPGVVTSAFYKGVSRSMCTSSVSLMSPFTLPSCFQVPGHFGKVGHIWMKLPLRCQLEFGNGIEGRSVFTEVVEQRGVRPQPMEGLNCFDAI